jgi:hypothetical protein
MFKGRYLLSDVARMLRRSEQSLILDIKLGLLKVQGTTGGFRRTGGHTDYSVTLGDLERFLGRDKARHIFGNRTKAVKAVEATQSAQKPARYKKCKTCGKLKPLEEFPREAGIYNWLSAECNSCAEKRR